MKSVNIVAMARWCPPPKRMKGDIFSINNSHAVWERAGLTYKPDLIIALDDLKRDVKHFPQYVSEIVDSGYPVYNTHNSRKWPTVKAYPLEKVWKVFHDKRLYDNSVNYAFMLALTEQYEKISFWGTDFVRPYDGKLLRSARLRWTEKGMPDVPDWFKYYDEMNVYWRGPGEPGWESFHTLLGMAIERGVVMEWHPRSSIMNSDRKPFFYGYTEQPDVDL